MRAKSGFVARPVTKTERRAQPCQQDPPDRRGPIRQAWQVRRRSAPGVKGARNPAELGFGCVLGRDFACTLAALGNTCGFAATAAQIIKFGARDFATADDVH